MEEQFLTKGSFFCMLFIYVRADSFFITQNDGVAIDSDNLSIDESFFDCDGTQSCKINTKKIAQGKQAVWEKVTFQSCREVYVNRDSEKRKYWIRHVGMLDPVVVRCVKKDGKIIAIMGHDSEANMTVIGYENPGSYRRNITYENKIRDIIRFVDTSASCKQFTRIDCHGMHLTSTSGQIIGYLTDRNRVRMDFIGGGPPGDKGCACGITDTCAKSGTKCNCDANIQEWKFDEGYVADKIRLPITEVRLGDTGGNYGYEAGYHTIGKLECEE